MDVRDLRRVAGLLGLVMAGTIAASCVRNPPSVEPDVPPPPPASESATRTPSPPPPAPPPPPPAPPVISESDEFSSRSLEELNRESPLQPVFFQYDSDDVSPEGQTVLAANFEILRRYPTWMITIEGHCDERGSPEYNLALGESRALAVREYLTELGLATSRIRTVSYGKEFPFDPGSTEEAWAKNRRAHFVITDR